MPDDTKITVDRDLIIQEELLRMQAIEAHYRNRNLYLVQKLRETENELASHDRDDIATIHNDLDTKD